MPTIPRRPFDFRQEEAAVPEANQQTESMQTAASPIQDENQEMMQQGVWEQNQPQGPEPMPAYDQSIGVGTVITEAEPQEETFHSRVIGVEQIHDARAIMQKYRQAKAYLDNRVIEEEKWWELRHWDVINMSQTEEERQKAKLRPRPTSAWLVNSIINKHADAMDNYPEPLVLPRELSDEQSANLLSSILPVVMEYNDFKRAYSDNWWEKLKHGTAVYGIFWDSTKENGLGDISIKTVDITKVLYEPGITDIQDSRNVFISELVDTDLLDQMYPEHAGKMSGSGAIDVPQYMYDSQVDLSEKSTVVDWYYKKHDATGRTVLHYVKFCNDEVLYASENDPKYADRGFYDHGKYPLVFDVLYPQKGTPAGYGIVSICRDPQLYIDELSSNLLQSSMMGSRKRFIVSDSADMNAEEFADWNNEVIKVSGAVGDDRFREVQINPPSPIYAQILQMKIDEMKDTSSNRDVNAGSTSSGITAAAAISALQEAGNKTSRDMIGRSYDRCAEIYSLCIELMRQFYDETRAFRVAGNNETEYQFAQISNAQLQEQPVGVGPDGQILFRRPIFDLKVNAQKRNPFSTMEGNQRAQELYGMGFFNPERAQEAMGALEMMEFEGIDQVKRTVREGQTLLNIVQQQMQVINQLTGAMGLPQFQGQIPGAGMAAPAPQQGAPAGGGADAALQPKTTSYQQRLAKRSTPDMSQANTEAANPARR